MPPRDRKQAADKPGRLPLVASPPGGAQALLPAIAAKGLIDSGDALTLDGLKLKVQTMTSSMKEALASSEGELKRSITDAEEKVKKRVKIDHGAACQMLQECESAMDCAKEQHAKSMRDIRKAQTDSAAQVDKAFKACTASCQAVVADFERRLGELRQRQGLGA